jgi:methyl-accepting chemotaxis protein
LQLLLLLMLMMLVMMVEVVVVVMMRVRRSVMRCIGRLAVGARQTAGARRHVGIRNRIGQCATALNQMQHRLLHDAVRRLEKNLEKIWKKKKTSKDDEREKKKVQRTCSSPTLAIGSLSSAQNRPRNTKRPANAWQRTKSTLRQQIAMATAREWRVSPALLDATAHGGGACGARIRLRVQVCAQIADRHHGRRHGAVQRLG